MGEEWVSSGGWVVLVRYLSHRFVRAHFDPIPLRWPFVFCLHFVRLLFPFCRSLCSNNNSIHTHTYTGRAERADGDIAATFRPFHYLFSFLPLNFHFHFFPLRVTKRDAWGGRRMPGGLIECWNEKRRKRKPRVKHEQKHKWIIRLEVEFRARPRATSDPSDGGIPGINFFFLFFYLTRDFSSFSPLSFLFFLFF